MTDLSRLHLNRLLERTREQKSERKARAACTTHAVRRKISFPTLCTPCCSPYTWTVGEKQMIRCERGVGTAPGELLEAKEI